ncbi:MAG TPA: asparagine synthase (glutamine-hydrolyzing) [Terriglobales bacterium]|jgi:asparagine synthase (glutamine-hydrolysing)|nr:asparagine synthase (glutamine-hydrolyzing) [Terriglobales bacterium]
MCGIVGMVARDVSVAPDVLERATQSLAHRGPDDSGTVIVRETTPEPLEIGLGNRRLAILDLSPLGHQPMQDPETGNWITFNGEIYNFREVRRKLEQGGVEFRSHSDTEVLLKAYGHWSERCLDELRGMFAFAIWDAKRHRLFLARDPMGIKPLYYASAGPFFLFASEARTLLGTGLVPRCLSRAGLVSYLSFGSLYDPITLIAGISALRAGHYLMWERGGVREVMYWDLAPHGERKRAAQRNEHATESERRQLVKDLHATLDEVVRMQMISDVPVGVFLSGGIDSSSLVGILGRAGTRVNTLSIVFREADFSEAKYSRSVAQAFGADHQEILVSQNDVLDAIPYALQAMDQPTIDGLNTYLISRQTRAAGIKVALSGLGGDELFAGYSSFQTVPRMERFARSWKYLPSPVRRSVAAGFALFSSNTDQNRKLSELVRGDQGMLHPYFVSRMLFMPRRRESLFVTRDDRAIERATVALEDSLARTHSLDAINRVSYLESRNYMQNTLLRDSDGMSMAHGLELRVPLIDHRLAEKLLALPGSWKLSKSTPKPLLVGALHGALPDEVVHRPKRGFTLPFERWLREQLKSEVEKTLCRSADGRLAAVLDPKAVQQVWGDFLNGRTSWSRPWSLYVLERWCELNSVTVGN